MKMRRLVVLFILILFIGIATVQINAEVLDTITTTENNDQEPEICCFGDIRLFDVKPGGVVPGHFQVGNCGASGSLLNWKVVEFPPWSTKLGISPRGLHLLFLLTIKAKHIKLY